MSAGKNEYAFLDGTQTTQNVIDPRVNLIRRFAAGTTTAEQLPRISYSNQRTCHVQCFAATVSAAIPSNSARVSGDSWIQAAPKKRAASSANTSGNWKYEP
jgi:hypothetical protein